MTSLHRSQPPIFPVNAGINIPAELFSLKNGIPLFIIDAGTEDVTRIEFVFRAGIVYETIPLVATSTNMMLSEGTMNYTAEELNSILDYYGVFLNLSAEKDTAGVTIYFLNKYIEKVLELMNEILFHPAFSERELDTMLKKRLSWYRINKQKVQNLATDNFFESVFGSNHPYGHQVKESDFEVVKSSLLREFHSRYYNPQGMTVIVSGKIHEKTITLFEHYFGELHFENNSPTDFDVPIKGSSEKKMFTEKKGALQTSVRIGSATINKRHPDYPGLKILNVILGGYFGSRLMKNIREEKGYTYGIHSSVTSLNLSGFKIISTEVGKKYTRKTAGEIYKEIRLLQTLPVPEDELEVVRNYMSGEMIRMFDGPFALAESFKSVWEFGLGNNYFLNFMDTIRTITSDEIIRLAQLYYNIDDLYEITAG